MSKNGMESLSLDSPKLSLAWLSLERKFEYFFTFGLLILLSTVFLKVKFSLTPRNFLF